MNRRYIVCLSPVVALGLALLTFAWPATAQDIKSSIVGVWKLTNHGNKNPTTGAVTHPYGQHPQGYHVFSKGGRMMFTMFGENRKPPTGSSPTDAERVALLQSVVSYIGTYRVEGAKVLIRIEANATPTDASDRTYTAEISGNKLTLTAEPFSAGTGQQQITIRTFDRAE
jgi:lipocalin-like protein